MPATETKQTILDDLRVEWTRLNELHEAKVATAIETLECRRDKDRCKLILKARKIGVTQEEIATAFRIGQSYISRLLVFSAFLEFIPTGISSEIPLSNITERKFREFWEQTSYTGSPKTEEERRFRAVWELMRKNMRLFGEKKFSVEQLVEDYGDWEYRTVEEMATAAKVNAKAITNAIARGPTKHDEYTVRVQKSASSKGDVYRLKKAKLIKTTEPQEVAQRMDDLRKLCKKGIRYTKDSNKVEYSRGMTAAVFEDIIRILEEL